ncbi:anthranilate synthase component I family protein [Shivajiella indica]|uniref:Anthranilate synthase component I family protein n=1 Tax=Shivajiella indica TaxID=872115 RepID=A0ABW5BA37_9BACT
MTKSYSIPIPSSEDWSFKLLSWLDLKFPNFAYFQNSGNNYPYGGFSHLIFAGSSTIGLKEIESYQGKRDTVGIVSFDYKNQIENLKSDNQVLIDLPDSEFLIPDLQIEIQDGLLIFDDADRMISSEEIFGASSSIPQNPLVQVQALTSYEKYLSDIEAIKEHIRSGDIYEMNYCMAFTFQDRQWDPIVGFLDLMRVSPMPFSVFYKSGDKYLICASPERFLKKTGKKLIAQPIKGTIKRGVDVHEDALLRNILLNSEKERAENLMIVDLIRNDLSKISETGSVQVEELFGVYPFAKVHQMISTVTAICNKGAKFKDIIHAAFPMGSMTGAPKIKCLELIEQYENFKRGWFSGSIGVIRTDGDFDFNVVIRSIVFDKDSGNGFFAVGSAITFDADAVYEYEECLLKASAILSILTSQN